MISVKEVIVCEGRYDKDTLSQIFDAVIIETGGFGVFNNAEKLALLRRLAEVRGLVILTDSDGAGFQIRHFLKGAIRPELVKHAYIPDIPGRERRKKTPSKAGTLGVEGMERDVLIEALRRSGATMDGVEGRRGGLSAAQLFELGLTGRPGSSQLRERLLHALGLPSKLKGASLRDVLGALYTPEEIAELVRGLDAPR